MIDELTDIQRLRNTALHNRRKLIQSTVIANVDEKNTLFKISGIGKSTVKLTVFVSYDSILKNKDNGLTEKLYKMINKVY